MIITVWDSQISKVFSHVCLHLDMDLCDKKILIKCIIIVGSYSLLFIVFLSPSVCLSGFPSTCYLVLVEAY